MSQNFHCQIDFRRDGQKPIVALGKMDLFIVKNNTARFVQNGTETILSGNPLDEFERILEEKRKTKNSNLSQSALAIGFLSYDAKSLIFPDVDLKNTDDFPQMWFAFPKENNFMAKQNQQKTDGIFANAVWKNTQKYEQSFAKIQNHLYEGDIYQANLTFPIEFDFTGDPYCFYETMCKRISPDMGAYFEIGDFQILSFSPERFFKIQNGTISANPIKGTASRSPNPTIDAERKRELLASEKDKAEHIMIVDLLRNDIGKISKIGSVAVENLFGIKSHETVHHLETEISGKLKTNSIAEIFKAMFPGGSITGAPKKSAVKIIEEVENYNRGIYTGAIGWIDFDGNVDFSVAIRTMTICKKRAVYPVGGGITVGSTADSEYDEALLKAKIITGEADALGISKR